jgi:hypothetical protein
MLTLFLLACAPAVSGSVRDRVALTVPDGWRVTRNYRAFGGDNVAMAKEKAAISLWVHNDQGIIQDYPLDVVASVRASAYGRSLGVESIAVAEHAVLIDGREAYAITGIRRWRTSTIAYSMVVTRTCDRVAELVLHAPVGQLDVFTRDWGQLLDSVALRESGWHRNDDRLFENEGWRHKSDCIRLSGDAKAEAPETGELPELAPREAPTP